MAVRLEFIDLIVPIETIRSKHPDGWDGFLMRTAAALNGAAWFDAHLYRTGAMGPGDIQHLMERWVGWGFEGQVEIDGKPAWGDICVVEGKAGGATLPCGWLEVDRERGIAWLAGTEPGEICGRAEIRPVLERLLGMGDD